MPHYLNTEENLLKKCYVGSAYKQRESESEISKVNNNYYSNFGCGLFVLAISAIHFHKTGMHVSENTHSGDGKTEIPLHQF